MQKKLFKRTSIAALWIVSVLMAFIYGTSLAENAFTKEVKRAISSAPGSEFDKTIAGAVKAYEIRKEQVTDPQLINSLNIQIKKLELAKQLNEINNRGSLSEFDKGIEMAKLSTATQIEFSGGSVTSVARAPVSTSLSTSVAALSAVYGKSLTLSELSSIKKLEAGPQNLSAALTNTINAFTHFTLVNKEVFSKIDPAVIRAVSDAINSGETKFTDAAAVKNAGTLLNLAPVLNARLGLLDAVKELNTAVSNPPNALNAAAVVPADVFDDLPCKIVVPLNPNEDLISIQVGGVDCTGGASGGNTYVKNTYLLIDAFGMDTYQNNAGGNGSYTTQTGCVSKNASALIDLGLTRDTYKKGTTGTRCGANGGGWFGSGFLIDAGGHDTLHAAQDAINGGAEVGTGLVLNIGGDDFYTGGSNGVNGGANTQCLNPQIPSCQGNLGPGYGMLIDTSGADTYTSSTSGGNGGARGTGSHGFLIDATGNDHYPSNRFGVNGGGYSGNGLLFDLWDPSDTTPQNESYLTADSATNGGCDLFGTGLAVDAAGFDIFSATNPGNFGVNGGAYNVCVSGLVSVGGSDTYTANFGGVNGEGDIGVALLLDYGSNGDTYKDLDIGTVTDKSVVPKGTFGALIDS